MKFQIEENHEISVVLDMNTENQKLSKLVKSNVHRLIYLELFIISKNYC